MFLHKRKRFLLEEGLKEKERLEGSSEVLRIEIEEQIWKTVKNY